jgi:hypothetical protein
MDDPHRFLWQGGEHVDVVLHKESSYVVEDVVVLAIKVDQPQTVTLQLDNVDQANKLLAAKGSMGVCLRPPAGDKNP